jgi:hypothetical protein
MKKKTTPKKEYILTRWVPGFLFVALMTFVYGLIKLYEVNMRCVASCPSCFDCSGPRDYSEVIIIMTISLFVGLGAILSTILYNLIGKK